MTKRTLAQAHESPAKFSRTYRGRFAPTPSGPLHLGSLLTALASWLEARSGGGDWLLRIDDLDRLRCVPGATEQILRQLEDHGLYWDGAPRYQSRHIAEYADARQQLQASAKLYGCNCTRARLQVESRTGIAGRIYSGRCRDQALPLTGNAQRLRVDSDPVTLDDRWQGRQERDPASDLGDFVIWRRDDIPGYALACVVDDLAMNISHVVRGADLLDASLQQMVLMRQLGAPAPHYAHLPVIAGGDGRKLSKQNHATPLDADSGVANLVRCLRWLGQDPLPQGVLKPEDILEFAVANWMPDKVPKVSSIAVEQCA